MTWRDDLATSISTVEGVNCTPYRRQTTTPGEAMVRFDRSARDDSGLGYLNTWQVCVILPQNVATADAWIDDHRDALIAAAEDHLVVTSLVVGQLPVDTSLVPCVVLEGVREN